MQFSQIATSALLACTAAAGKVAHPKKIHPTGIPYSPSNPAHEPPYDVLYNGTDTWVTTTVTNFVKYCPEPTQFSVKGHTYSATHSQWVNVTHCPDDCTISYKASPTGHPMVIPGTVVPATPTGVMPHPGNGTKPAPTGVTPVEGAGNKVGATGALAVAFAAAAYIL